MSAKWLTYLTIGLQFVLIACGSETPRSATTTVVPSPSTAAPTATAPPPGTPVTDSAASASGLMHAITEADNGMTVQLAVGAVIMLTLRAPLGSDPWQVHPPDPQILIAITSPGITAAPGMTVQAYRAVAAGQTAITAESRPHCDPGKACAQVIQGFRVTVMVTI